MRLLLDTHTFLWFVTNDPQLSENALEAVAEPANEVLLSPASYWEIAIKVGLGKLSLPMPPGDYVPDRLLSSGVVGLPIEHGHALHVASLPYHHRDPFDRLLIAQAQIEQLTILTADRQLAQYDVQIEEAE